MSGWEGLLAILQKPETLAMAQGMLNSPSGNLSGAFGHGIQAMQSRGDTERQKAIEQGKLKVLEGGLDVDRGRLGVDKQKHSLEEKKFGLTEKEYLEKAQNLRDLMNSFMPQQNQSSPPISFEQMQQPAQQAAPQMPQQQFSPMGGAAMSSPSLLDPNNPTGQQAPMGMGLLNTQPAPQGPASPYIPEATAGILGQNMPQQAPQASALPPPAQQAIPEGAGIKGGLERRQAAQDDGLITLNNGMRVTPDQLRLFKAYMAAQKPEKAIEALTGGSNEPELIKIAKAAGLVPGTPEFNKFLIDSKLKPQNQINIGDEATRSFVTKQQNVIGGVDSVLPSINELIKLAERDEIPFQGLGAPTLSPNLQAKYEALSSQAIEPLLGSFALNSNEHNAKMVAKQIERQPYESKDAYVKRLKDLKADLINRRKYAAGITSFKGMPEFPAFEGVQDSESSTTQGSNMVTIRNSETGETRRVTRDEAEKLTGKK